MISSTPSPSVSAEPLSIQSEEGSRLKFPVSGCTKVGLNISKVASGYAPSRFVFTKPVSDSVPQIISIVSPDIKGIIVTPISPHSLSARPIVLDEKNKIQVSFDEDYSRINITADGQKQIKINSKCIIKIKKSNIKVKLIYPEDMESYYFKLRNKLNWFGKY